MSSKMSYCEDAKSLLGIDTVCGKCPMYKTCPRIILEDATDKAINKAMKAMIKNIKKGEDEKIRS